MRKDEIGQNLEQVKEKLAAACKKAGRDPRDVTICAVSKTKPTSDIVNALSCGQHLFGENYVQELVGKYEELGDKAEFHMIGHLQRNKVKYIIDKALAPDAAALEAYIAANDAF